MADPKNQRGVGDYGQKMVFKGLQPCYFFGSAEKKEKNNFVRGWWSPVRRTAGSASVPHHRHSEIFYFQDKL